MLWKQYWSVTEEEAHTWSSGHVYRCYAIIPLDETRRASATCPSIHSRPSEKLHRRCRSRANQEIPLAWWNQRFVTAFTTAHDTSLSWARSMQPTSSSLKVQFCYLPIYAYFFQADSFRQISPHHNPVWTSPLLRRPYMPRPVLFFFFNHSNVLLWAVEVTKLLFIKPSQILFLLRTS